MNNIETSKGLSAEPQCLFDDSTASVQLLLAEESASMRLEAQALLESENYSVILAQDGFEALALVEQHHPAIVLADIMLPRVDGYQLCSLIRRNPAYRDIPVILLSPHEGVLDQGRADLVGSHAHVCKPDMGSTLVDVLRAFT